MSLPDNLNSPPPVSDEAETLYTVMSGVAALFVAIGAIVVITKLYQFYGKFPWSLFGGGS
jgi:hypothetical protein